MDDDRQKRAQVACRPVTPERWEDLEALFGERGACGGCWCMWLRLTSAQFERQQGEANRQALAAIVEAGRVPGLLAYLDGAPVGWCAVAPREEYPRLERSRILKRLDDTPVWSVTCFFVDKGHRGRGITGALLRAAIDYVRGQGGRVLEAYPIDRQEGRMPAAFAWPGLASVFSRVGFVECARRSETRPIMRYTIGEESA